MPIDEWSTGFDRRHRFGIPIHNPLQEVAVSLPTITLPKRQRESSFKDEDVQDALDTLRALEDEGREREAIVVGTGFESENSARNRARLMANALHDKTNVLYSAHAVPDPDNEGTFIGAVSVRANQNPRETSNERPEDAPSMRALQQAARDYNIKGRSKLDYDGLWDALESEGADPMSYGTGSAS